MLCSFRIKQSFRNSWLSDKFRHLPIVIISWITKFVKFYLKIILCSFAFAFLYSISNRPSHTAMRLLKGGTSPPQSYNYCHCKVKSISFHTHRFSASPPFVSGIRSGADWSSRILRFLSFSKLSQQKAPAYGCFRPYGFPLWLWSLCFLLSWLAEGLKRENGNAPIPKPNVAYWQ